MKKIIALILCALLVFCLCACGDSDGQGDGDSANIGLTKAADFIVTSQSGEEIWLSAFFEKPVVLNFWASWCPPCKGEMPDFEKMYQEYGDRVNFVMVSVDDSMSDATAFMEKAGYTFCIVNTGGNHVDLTDDYAAVPKEMHACAALMGKKVLRECDEAEFVSRISYMRANVGDRAILRALHYFGENKRVEAQRAALKGGDADTFFRLVTESGRSSFEFLQNVFTTRNVSEQGISLALALSERFGAVCRVHGGGFAGTIQAYVPTANVEAYREAINNVFGKNACMLLRIRPYGASVVDQSGVKES